MHFPHMGRTLLASCIEVDCTLGKCITNRKIGSRGKVSHFSPRRRFDRTQERFKTMVFNEVNRVISFHPYQAYLIFFFTIKVNCNCISFDCRIVRILKRRTILLIKINLNFVNKETTLSTTYILFGNH